MKLRTISNVALQAITGALPQQLVTQTEFAALYGEKEAARIIHSTGISSKRAAGALKTSDLIEAACRNLFKQQIVSPAEIDGLIVVTQTPDAWSPGTGFLLHSRLGLGQDCIVLDLNAGCAGYISALLQGSALIASGICTRILVCTGDVTTKLLDDNDRHVNMLFGDGASVTLLGKGNGSFDFICGADGEGYAAIGADLTYDHSGVKVHPLHMDGTAVMNFALAKVPETINMLMHSCGETTTSLDLLVLHQANAFMLNYLRRILRMKAVQIPIDIDGIGNTSSTSIPLVLSRHAIIGTAAAKSIVLCGFGVGLAWGAVKLNLQKTITFPPVDVAAGASTTS